MMRFLSAAAAVPDRVPHGSGWPRYRKPRAGFHLPAQREVAVRDPRAKDLTLDAVFGQHLSPDLLNDLAERRPMFRALGQGAHLAIDRDGAIDLARISSTAATHAGETRCAERHSSRLRHDSPPSCLRSLPRRCPSRARKLGQTIFRSPGQAFVSVCLPGACDRIRIHDPNLGKVVSAMSASG